MYELIADTILNLLSIGVWLLGLITIAGILYLGMLLVSSIWLVSKRKVSAAIEKHVQKRGGPERILSLYERASDRNLKKYLKRKELRGKYLEFRRTIFPRMSFKEKMVEILLEKYEHGKEDHI